MIWAARIVKVEVLAHFRLRPWLFRRNVVTADLRPTIQQGGVFSQLADPAFFTQVRLDPRGSPTSWPGEIDFCADALRESADAAAAA